MKIIRECSNKADTLLVIICKWIFKPQDSTITLAVVNINYIKVVIH